ncbi:hypothetical protein Tco_0194363 [Tanacetum coccineum]
MEISIADQIALDDALVAPADRLKIGKCNLRLSSDVTSKEATLQVVYDVLKLTPFYKAFQVTADAPEIYMQEFWASAYVHNRSVRFKMNNKKHILDLDQFRDILQICPKVGNKKFEEPPLEKEILAFLASLGHSGEIRKIIDVNKNVDYAYLLWEDFIFKIENKNTKKGNAMYYPRFTKLVVNFVMEKDTKTDLDGRDEVMTDVILPQLKPLHPKEKKEKTSRKGKQKAKDGSGVDEGTGVTPGVPDAPDYDSDTEISWKSSDDIQDDEKAQDNEDEDKNDENETTHDDEDDDDESQTESEDDGDDFIHPKLTTHDDEIIHEEETDEDDTFDPIVHTPSRISSSDDEDSNNEVEGMDVEGAKSDEDATYVEDQGNEAIEDTNANLEGRDDVMTDVILPLVQATQEIEDTHVTLTLKHSPPNFASLVRSSKEANTSHAVAANLSELELKKILIDKMEANNSINRSDIQRKLYKALVDTLGSKRRRSGKEHASTSAPRETTTTTAGKTTTTGSKTHKQYASQSALVEETMQTTDVFEAPAHQEFETGVHDEQAEEEVQHLPDWFQQPTRLPSPDHAWICPTFELMKGTCKSLTELEYFCEEVYKATTKKLDWINPEGRQYPHDLRQPLPLVPNSQGRHVIPFHHFINNDLEYLRGGESSRKYSTSVTKTMAADYGHIKWIEDLVPNSMWSQMIVKYDKFALWGISHWGKKRRQFYAFATTRESARDVYSKRRIIAVTKVEIVEWHNYKHLDWITVRRDDDILYKFKEGDFQRLRIQDIEDMLLLLCGHSQRRVEDLQLGVESYQKKLNLTKPDTYRSNLRRRDAYTPYSDPRGFIYENKDKKKQDLIALTQNQNYTSQRDKANARAMIQAIDKRLKSRRIMRSLERFVGGRPYGDCHGPIDANAQPTLKPLKVSSKDSLVSFLTENTKRISIDFSHSEIVDIEKTEMELTLEQTQQGVSYEVSNIRVNSFTMKMEILLEPTSNKLMVEHAEYDESNTYVLERFNTTAGNPVKKILLKLNLSDHRLFKDGGGDFRYSDTTHLSRSVEVLKLKIKNFKKDATLKLFKNGMSMSVQKSQVHKMAKLQDGEEIMLG